MVEERRLTTKYDGKRVPLVSVHAVTIQRQEDGGKGAKDGLDPTVALPQRRVQMLDSEGLVEILLVPTVDGQRVTLACSGNLTKETSPADLTAVGICLALLFPRFSIFLFASCLINPRPSTCSSTDIGRYNLKAIRNKDTKLTAPR